MQTSDGMVYVASEVGVLGDVLTNAENVVAKGRLGPGQMVCADLEAGTFKTNTGERLGIGWWWWWQVGAGGDGWAGRGRHLQDR